jgi:hypothetical protein
MLKLNVSTAAKTRHLSTLGKRFDDAMGEWKAPFTGYPAFTPDLHQFLLDHREEILVGSAAKLRNVIFGFDSIATGFTNYLKNRPKQRVPKPSKRQADMEELLKKLSKVFSYSTFIYKSAGWNAYKLVEDHGLRTCPYCQLHHVNYHGQATGKLGKLELRPPLDHFLPKSIYPYLAVSLHNLVPSCHQCNSSIKGDKDPASIIPNPFDSGVPDLSFSIDNPALAALPIAGQNLKLKVTTNGSWSNFVGFFHLQERYQWYAPEVKDMLGRKRDLEESDDVIRSMVRRQSLILGFEPGEFEKRTLGICLRDIARQMGVL